MANQTDVTDATTTLGSSSGSRSSTTAASIATHEAIAESQPPNYAAQLGKSSNISTGTLTSSHTANNATRSECIHIHFTATHLQTRLSTTIR